MRVGTLITLILFLLIGNSGCGFLDEARVCEGYIENVAEPLWPDEPAVALVTWPILIPLHAGGLAVSATVDQTCRTFESAVPASIETKNYFLLPVPEDNVLLHRSLILPKFVATPLIWVGSYLVRWFLPIGSEDFVISEPEESE